uniref:RRM domain-containing protein n=1 Tax=Caenorhabditis japonica TaxID=281687 RepID=A0A8R1EXF8_CAEJA
MRIQYAREDSDAIARAKGTYVEKRLKTTLTKSGAQKKPYDRPANGKVATTAAENGEKNGDRATEEGPGEPNNILFCSAIPEGTDQEQIHVIFNQFPGLREVRWMPNSTEFAFIEYESTEQSEPARKALDNFRITPTHQIKVKFANK